MWQKDRWTGGQSDKNPTSISTVNMLTSDKKSEKKSTVSCTFYTYTHACPHGMRVKRYGIRRVAKIWKRWAPSLELGSDRRLKTLPFPSRVTACQIWSLSVKQYRSRGCTQKLGPGVSHLNVTPGYWKWHGSIRSATSDLVLIVIHTVTMCLSCTISEISGDDGR